MVMTTPIQEYHRRLDAGEMRANPTQDAAVEVLGDLFSALENRVEAPKRGFWSFGRQKQPAVNGVYLHGPVGRGKTTIMDLFYDVLPGSRKRRTHFHEFMLEIHAKIHALQLAKKKSDPIKDIANTIARDVDILCFDEFVVNNIADAMILGRLYEALLVEGVVVVATSNFQPKNLYKNGLQRERFLPFIDLLERNTNAVYVNHAEDYRRLNTQATELGETYFLTMDVEVESKLKQRFEILSDGQDAKNISISIGSRSLEIPRAVEQKIAWLDFETFLNNALGPADFLAIARNFPAVIVSDVPMLDPAKRNQARRFMTLVDALYNLNRKLIISAAAEPDDLYPEGDGAFEFKRTASRLMEMRSEAYLSGC
ncbi:MAG: cell division protein ZapE [Alphaproteobacteria bacterium]